MKKKEKKIMVQKIVKQEQNYKFKIPKRSSKRRKLGEQIKLEIDRIK